MELITLGIICFIGGVLSSVVGVGGGILVLSLLLTMMPFLIASALHSIIMMIANIQKSVMLISYIRMDIVWKFLMGAIPGALFGAYVVTLIPAQWLYLIFGVFLLVFCYAEIAKSSISFTVTKNDFYWVGGLTGFSAGILGAPGPIHAPFFMRYGLTKEAFIATASLTTIVVHVSKLSIFWQMDIFSQIEPWDLIIGISATLIGVYVGIIFLKKMRTVVFQRLMIAVLGILGTYYLIKASTMF